MYACMRVLIGLALTGASSFWFFMVSSIFGLEDGNGRVEYSN